MVSATAIRSAPRAAAATRDYETTALIDALGDFLLFMQRENALRHSKDRRKTASRSGQEASDDTRDRELKRSVFAWLSGLGESDWASLWTVVDPGFVKTVLAMGMAARSVETESGGLRKRRRGCAVQGAAPSVSQFQLVPQDAVMRRLSPATVAAQPREFLRRPVVVTRDGDALGGFHSPSFAECCAWLVRSLCVLNTERSCDTLVLASATGEETSRIEWLGRLDVIAGGNFMLNRPSTRPSQQQQQQSQVPAVWAQTTWFSTRAYFAIAELIVNQLELSIWHHWSEAQRAPSYRIPREGLPVKLLLADEWRLGSAARQQQALASIGFQVAQYLKQLTPPSSRATMTVSLSTLKDVMDAWSGGYPTREPLSARSLFSLPLPKLLASPHAAAVSLLVAEFLQDQCAKMLSESLTNPHESDEIASPGKSTHAKRRRAARKKTVKQRKHELESRGLHKNRLNTVLVELRQAVRAWQDRIVQSVSDVLAGIVDSVVAANVEVEEHDYRDDDHEGPVDEAASRPKRRKKRGKKKSKQKTSDETAMDYEQPGSQQAKENLLPNGDVYSLSMQRPDHTRPLISFLAQGSDDMVYTTPPRHPVSSFNPHSFYPTASPFFLQLSAQPHETAFGPHLPRKDERDHSQERGFEGDDEDDGKEKTSPTTDENESSPSEPNFDWYLPSLFSSQSSVHTNSTVSSLDWDFQRWSMKTETNSTAAPVSINTKLRPLLKAPERDTAAVAAIVEDASSSDSNFPLPSFSSFIDISSEASSKSESASPVADTTMETDDAARSDFLYREGGFFDRQRGSKRRRRPFPFEYDDDDDEDEDDDEDTEARSTAGRRSRHRSWEERASGSSAKSHISERSTASTGHSGLCVCNKPTVSVSGFDQEESSQSAASARLVERIAKLEGMLEDKLATFDKETAAMSAEVTGLQQQVSVLSQRVKSLEAELEDARRPQSEGNSDPSVVATNSPPLAPPAESFSQAALVPTVQAYPHPIMRPGGASNFSILGPFVSVPMSVLPPRSKLHWDMCEYVSQLQADSTARVSAQMAAIRLCTSAVQSLWPRAQVRPYGSFVTRLALPTSDVDLVICLPKVRRDAPADAAGVLEGRNAIKESWQQNLARKLTQEPWVVPDSVKTIPHAAIPIITLVTKLPFKVRLDISFEGPGHNGLATNDVVLSLIHEFPPLAPVMLVLKSFVIERGFAVAYSGGLSSYALLLMVARYLQEHTDRYDNSSQAPASSCADFGMVLMGLLDFYGNRFEPRTTGISVAGRCFFDRDSIVASNHHPHHQYASGHATSHTAVMHSVDDAQDHWQQVHQSSHMHSANLLSSPGSRRHNNRTTMNDWPMQRSHYQTIPDAMATAAPHDPHKFDPLFIEDPLHPSNNVGRNCFRISQIRRAFASGYTTLMAASMSAAVASESRGAVVGGVALHPDNILRSILGPNAPTLSNNGAATAAVNVKNDASNTPAPAMYQHAKSRGGQHHGPHTGARLGPAIMHLYDQQHAPGGFVSGGGVAYYHGHTPPTNGAGGASASAAAPPYMLHRMQQQQYQQQYQQYPQQAYQQQYYPVSKPQGRPVEPGGPAPSSTSTYRRHSGSLSEQMTTRSEAASSSSTDKYYVKRSKPVDRSLALSPRLIPPTMQRSSSIELDKKTMSASSSGVTAIDVKSSATGRGSLTRKNPSRSMSFADVVMSGAVGSSAVSAVKVEQKKAPSSPLTLAPSARRRPDAAAEDAFNERLETKDDFELK